MNGLPASIGTPDEQRAYFAFFDEYGTHYLESGTMGGIIVMETTIADTLLEHTSALEVSAAVNAGYNGLINNGSLNVSTAYNSSAFLSNHRNEIQVQITTLGGLFAPNESIADWQKSIFNTPRLLLNVPGLGIPPLSRLKCVSELVPLAGAAPVIAGNILAMLHAYTTPLYADDGLLASPSDVDVNTVTQVASGGGFLLGTLRMVANGDRARIYAFDDRDGDPATLRACASQHFFLDHDRVVPSASFLMPAPDGLTYRTDLQVAPSRTGVTVKFIGIGNVGDEALQPWQPVPLNAPVTAPLDGFVVASVDWNNQNGARGFVHGRQMLNGVQTTVAGASQHLFTGSDDIVPCNSFTMPVRRDVSYRVDFVPTALAPAARAWFVPLNPSAMKFGEFSSRRPESKFLATSDGFLVTYLFMQTDGDRGFVDVYSAPDPNVLFNGENFVTSTSIHYFTRTDAFVPYNTATIPIARNNHYAVRFVPTAGNPGVMLLWVPLLRA